MPDVRLSEDYQSGQWQRIYLADMYLSAYQRLVILEFSRLGQPPDNAPIEALNSKRSEA